MTWLILLHIMQAPAFNSLYLFSTCLPMLDLICDSFDEFLLLCSFFVLQTKGLILEQHKKN